VTTTYGLTNLGFFAKTQNICRAEMTESLQGLRGASVDCSDGSLEGQVLGILSEREGAIWDILQSLYSSQDPDAASGAAQDAICALTATIRANARASVVTETLTGASLTVVSSGTQIKTASTGAVFSTTANATLAALSVWTLGTMYALGQRVTNGGNAYQCITAGTSAGSGGPTTTAADITDNTVHWTYLGAGVAAVDVVMKSLTKDAIVAVARDLTVIQTPVGGLTGAINLLDAAVGALVQQDGSLRLTREAELAQAGNSTADAIRAAVLDVTGVTACTVLVNNTDAADGNGQPPHSVQVVVDGGDDTAIATVLSQNVAGGIQTVSTGGTSVPIVLPDSQGVNHTWTFTRPALVNIYVDVTLTYNPAASSGYPSDGDTEVQLSIVTLGNTFPDGKDVVASNLSAVVFPIFINGAQVAGVRGVLDVSSMKIGTAPSPSGSTTIVIDAFHRASFDTSRVTVHSSPGSF
jgi:hypothetical protein